MKNERYEKSLGIQKVIFLLRNRFHIKITEDRINGVTK